MNRSFITKLVVALCAVVMFCSTIPAYALPPGVYFLECRPGSSPILYNILGQAVAYLYGPCPNKVTVKKIVISSLAVWNGNNGPDTPPYYEAGEMVVDGLTAIEFVEQINNEYVPVGPNTYPPMTPPSSTVPTLQACECHFTIP